MHSVSKGPQFAKDSINADQFDRMFEVIRDKNLTVRTRWMPSHLGDSPEEVGNRRARDKNKKKKEKQRPG